MLLYTVQCVCVYVCAVCNTERIDAAIYCPVCVCLRMCSVQHGEDRCCYILSSVCVSTYVRCATRRG